MLAAACWTFVISAQDEAEKIGCPFSGGYTFRAYRNHRKMVNVRLRIWFYSRLYVREVVQECCCKLIVEFYLYPTVGTVLIHSIKPELTE